jgi:hypothetical protein
MPKGLAYLRNKLNIKRSWVKQKYKFYDMKNVTVDLGISTPPSLRAWNSVVGWSAKAVDAIADRLVFRGFAGDDILNIWEIFRLNNSDVLFDSAILGALISACDFIYISEDENGFPRLQALDGKDATGIIDPITNMLLEGYAVLERDDMDKAVVEAYFTPGQTEIHRKGEKAPEIFTNAAPYPLLVPIIHKPDATHPFGRSVISRACIAYTGGAVRTIKRSEISAEFYSFPQKYILGTDPEAEQMETWRAAMSAMLQFDRDENGNVPTLGQFTQQSMQPHMDQLKTFAALFAGESGLTLDDLGFPTANPSSSDAIKASHENLRLKARKAQRSFGNGFRNVGYLAACVRDDTAYDRSVFADERPLWEPIFEADISQLSGIGDAVLKIQQSFPDYFDEEKLRDLTGI